MSHSFIRNIFYFERLTVYTVKKIFILHFQNEETTWERTELYRLGKIEIIISENHSEQTNNARLIGWNRAYVYRSHQEVRHRRFRSRSL
jgi:hypothetical protein